MRKFEHISLPELCFDLTAETTESGRKYFLPDGQAVPSITTVLSTMSKEHIDKWRASVGEERANKISRMASSRGTKLHDVCEKYLLNEMNSMKLQTMMPDTKQLFKTLRPQLDENIGKIYALEQALYSKELMLAGRVDCIAEWNGVLSVIDFKTSTKIKDVEKIKNYFMQCTTYSIMFEELTGKPINQIVVAIAVEEDVKPQIFVKDKSEYVHFTKDFIKNYHLTNAK